MTESVRILGKKELKAEQIKTIAFQKGADLCGVAPIERFDEAPIGYHPRDVYPDTRSVLVVAKRLPDAVMRTRNPVPYSYADDTILNETQRLALDISLMLQDHQIVAVPVPSEPYLYWDEERKEGRGTISLKHAGYLAGLGVIGKNSLLINEQFGNRISLGALLLDISLPGDTVAEFNPCENCNVCIQSCPVKAITGETVIQKLCREHSYKVTAKGYNITVCNTCRRVCPNGRGWVTNARK